MTICRPLAEPEINRDLFRHIARYQGVPGCRRKGAAAIRLTESTTHKTQGGFRPKAA